MPKKHHTKHHVWWLTGTLLSGALVVALVMWLLSTPSDRGSTDHPKDSAGAQFTLQQELFADSRNVTVAVEFHEPSILYAPADGILTASQCTPGAEIVAGSIPFQIDGNPILALAAPSPFWRDLHLNDQGEDVTSLQTALRDLGYVIHADGVVDWATTQAFYELLERPLPYDTSEWVIARSSILWLPHAAARADTCPGKLGTPQTSASPLVHTNGELARAALAPLPPNAYPGARKVVINDTEFATDASGAVAPPDLPGLAYTLTQTPPTGTENTDAAAAEPSGSESTVAPGNNSKKPQVTQATFLLTDPLPVWPVPVSAVTGANATHGCVWQGSQGFPVTLITSQLGKTLITFAEGTTPPKHIDTSPKSGRDCA